MLGHDVAHLTNGGVWEGWGEDWGDVEGDGKRGERGCRIKVVKPSPIGPEDYDVG